MNRMQTIMIAALIAGLLSLAGVCYLIYASMSSGGIKAQQQTSQNIDTAVLPRDNSVPTQLQPSKAVMRRTSFAVPGYSVARQIISSFPAIRQQVQRQSAKQRQLEAAEQQKLDEMERSFFTIDAEAPLDNNVPKTEPVKPATHAKQQVETEPKQAEKSTVPAGAKTTATRPVLPEEGNSTNADRKQLMVQAGRQLPVREMRKRFDGTLSDQQLNDVLNDIFKRKGEEDSYATCVHIKALPETEKTAHQLAIYLVKQGFTMAGRSEAEANERGIRVNAKGQCVVVTLGRM